MPKFASWTTGAPILFNAKSVAKDVGSGNVGLKNTLLQPGGSKSAPEKNVPQPGSWLWGPWNRKNASSVALSCRKPHRVKTPGVGISDSSACAPGRTMAA